MAADLVIGSGPAGFAVALARLGSGREVVMIDPGQDIEPSAETARLAYVAAAGDGPGEMAARSDWMRPQFSTPPGQARRFGSDFAMEAADATYAPGSERVALRESRAVGGLSNLWGGALLTWRAEDIAGWPVDPGALARAWSALAAHVPVAGVEDTGLSGRFPDLPMTSAHPLAPGPQIERLLGRARARQDRLAGLGAAVGPSRLAIGPECRRCGLCLHGCPWGEIWSARAGLARLADARGFARRRGLVRAVTEDEAGATAHLADGTSIRGDRLFLAAGVLATSRIWLASGDASTLTLRDSSFVFLPALQPGTPAPSGEVADNPTLAQAFVELDPEAPGRRSAHAQLYGWNEFYARDLLASYGRLGLARPILRRLARHLIVAQLFLHSDHCSGISLRLAPDGRLLASRVPAPSEALERDRALRRLSAVLRTVGLVPLRAAARPAAVGASFHVGASLPMSASADPGSSDPLGRPRRGGRLHVVDASVLPAIPATTITFGVMGNAWRIGAEAP